MMPVSFFNVIPHSSSLHDIVVRLNNFPEIMSVIRHIFKIINTFINTFLKIADKSYTIPQFPVTEC